MRIYLQLVTWTREIELIATISPLKTILTLEVKQVI
jgi:hypothetical protein